METLGPFKGIYRAILGSYWGHIGVILELFWDNGKENGNGYNIIEYILGLYWDNGEKRKLL